jgi:uncharacterized protein YggT (Ycf19 family)
METTEKEKSTSVMPPETQGAPTIGAKPIQAQSVVNPIRLRFRGAQVVWYLLGVIEIILFLRFVLKFIGANQAAGFTQFIYAISYPFAGAFANVVSPSRIGNSVIDWSILGAIIIYGLVAWGIVKLFVMTQPVSDQEAHNKLDV